MKSKQKIINGDCIETMKRLKSCSISAILTDPPAGIAFMTKKWDDYGELINFQNAMYDTFTEAFRIMKPGGFVICWAIPRTAHHTAMGLERAGFNIRDKIYHIFGSGFPKAQDICKQMEAKMKTGKSNSRSLRKIEQEGNGKEYTMKGVNNGIMGEKKEFSRKEYNPDESVKEWSGYKTPALKPAAEEWIIAQKPMLDEGEPNEIDYDAPFFYAAKCSTKERTCNGKVKNNHPTIKSVKLMEYFIDLITPPENYKKDFVILDPFCGSGTTLLAAKKRDVNAIGIEKEEEYVKIIQQRLEAYGSEK